FRTFCRRTLSPACGARSADLCGRTLSPARGARSAQLLFVCVENDLDVTGSLSDRSRATLRCRHEAAERRTLVHDCVLDVERIDVDRLIPLSRLELGVR